MRLCMPTSTFSTAVMFANSRMFWNVRPTPSATMSFGRALRKIPARCSRCTYQGGRMIATMSERDQEPERHEDEQLAADLEAGRDGHRRRPDARTAPGSANQKNGSTQARRGARHDRLAGK